MIDLPQYRDLHDLQCFLFSLFFLPFMFLYMMTGYLDIFVYIGNGWVV
jgi:hypothetical protein